MVVPFAITVYVFWSLATWLGGLGYGLMEKLGGLHNFKPNQTEQRIAAFIGGVLVVGSVYVVGLLTNLLVFRKILAWLERLVGKLPGAKTIYESVRDLMNLFGGDSTRMGRAVLYKPPGADVKIMGILTNDKPPSVVQATGEHRVAIYLPFSYMLGGATVFVSPKDVQEIDLSVEQVLKLCTTAHVGGARPGGLIGPGQAGPPTREPK